MFYSFRCTYCSRVFYTYDTNKTRASRTLYSTVKQHLIETDEDRKEFQMDDGETADSNQIYAEMVESNQRPSGGYEANSATGLKQSGSSSSGTIGSSYAGTGIIVLFIFVIAIVMIIYFMFTNNIDVGEIFSALR